MSHPNFPDSIIAGKAPKLLDMVRDKLRLKHYSLRTEQAYVDWIKRYILFHGKCHPREMGEADIEAFLTHLAVKRNVAASTQNQAKSALLYLYREVLEIELPWLDNVTQANVPKRLPVVLSVSEVQSVLAVGYLAACIGCCFALWRRFTLDGGSAATGEGCGC